MSKNEPDSKEAASDDDEDDGDDEGDEEEEEEEEEDDEEDSSADNESGDEEEDSQEDEESDESEDEPLAKKSEKKNDKKLSTLRSKSTRGTSHGGGSSRRKKKKASKELGVYWQCGSVAVDCLLYLFFLTIVFSYYFLTFHYLLLLRLRHISFILSSVILSYF